MKPSISEKISNSMAENGFFERLGINRLPDDRKEQVIHSAINTVLDMFLLKIGDMLGEEELKQVVDLLDLKKEEEAIDMLSIKIPNLDELLLVSVVEYQQEIESQYSEATQKQG
jgi:hypothetical protein